MRFTLPDPLQALIAALFVAGGAVLLYGLCDSWAASSVTHGTIVDKTHQANWIQQQMILVDDQWVSTVTVWPETWNITVEGTNSSGATKRRIVSVTEDRWRAVRVGEKVTL